ncbi:MAG: MFS transporter, partial [Pseudomonadales bacterium]|nr:MFS transporter [Pseudomonadales bacterium]
TASVLKLLSGWLADRGWNAKGLVLGGYGISNIARPLIALALGWWLVLVMRFLDRVGKGLRTAPRDALIAHAAPADRLGRAFGFHRAMDHAGAVIGPLIAFFLLASGVSLRDIFWYSAVPGAIVLLLLIFALPQQELPLPPARTRLRWSLLDVKLKGLVIASGGLALATTPEAFLILWAQTRGLDIAAIPLVWAAASLVKMLLVMPAGSLSDKLGRLPVVIFGWLARIMLLIALAFAGSQSWLVWALFLAYAGSLAITEAAERSLVGEAAPIEHRATLFGVYHVVVGLFALPGAVLFGLVWQLLDQQTAFLMAALLTLVASASLLWMTRKTAAAAA